MDLLFKEYTGLMIALVSTVAAVGITIAVLYKLAPLLALFTKSFVG